MPVGGGESELVIQGVQATSGGLCEGGWLYLPVWDFGYYGSTESDGVYTDYFSRTSGAVAAVALDGLKIGALVTDSALDFSAVYAVTDGYVFGKAANPASAYADGSNPSEFYALYSRIDGNVRTVEID